jgi:hypothetical protein
VAAKAGEQPFISPGKIPPAFLLYFMVVLLEKIFLSHLRLRHTFITLEQPEIESLQPLSGERE